MTGWPHRRRLGKLKKVIIKKCGISLPKVRDDLCRYSLDPASERGMTEWAHRGYGMTRQALRGIGEGIKKEPEGCLLLTSFRLIF